MNSLQKQSHSLSYGQWHVDEDGILSDCEPTDTGPGIGTLILMTEQQEL